MSPSNIEFRIQIEPDLKPSEFIDILRRSTLADRRPVDDFDTIEGMLDNADIILTARNPDGQLVGVARSITDFNYCTYLSDLAVDVNFQRLGLGKRLIERTHQVAGKNTTLLLLSAPAAKTYYPHIGLSPHDSCWILAPEPLSAE